MIGILSLEGRFIGDLGYLSDIKDFDDVQTIRLLSDSRLWEMRPVSVKLSSICSRMPQSSHKKVALWYVRRRKSTNKIQDVSSLFSCV